MAVAASGGNEIYVVYRVSAVHFASTLRTYLEAVFASVSASSDVAFRTLDIHVGRLSEFERWDIEGSEAL
jgi:hypothetical protein